MSCCLLPFGANDNINMIIVILKPLYFDQSLPELAVVLKNEVVFTKSYIKNAGVRV